jgi:hypothetical protein
MKPWAKNTLPALAYTLAYKSPGAMPGLLYFPVISLDKPH